MKILAVDIGTGTQDILLFDSEREVENCLKMVQPSPTIIVAERIRQATAAQQGVVLTGVTMGGGPCMWAAADHVRAGQKLYVTPQAGRTFNDDLAAVEEMGGVVASEDELRRLAGDVVRIDLKDFDYAAISASFAHFGVDLDTALDAVAVAVFDHGDAPPGMSDRLFRFQFLGTALQARNDLTAFSFLAEEVPPFMGRMRAVVSTLPQRDYPAMIMDTAPAAVLGALEDERLRTHYPLVVANIGNFHCLAFRLGASGVEGLFEHHTGEISPRQLEEFIISLAAGSLTHQQIFDSNGHGAVLFTNSAVPLDFLAVTGPRRSFVRGTGLRPYFAVPFGDMMLAGCYGMIRAFAEHMPQWREEIEATLAGTNGCSLW